MNGKASYIYIILYPLLALLAMSLPSCSTDISLDEPAAGHTGDAYGTDSVLYFSLRVLTSDSEQLTPDAPEYVDGSEFEHAVDYTKQSENVIIFLNPDWSYAGYSRLQFDRFSATGDDGKDATMEASYIGFLRPDYHEAFIMPQLGMMVLNAGNITKALDELANTSATIDDILALTDKSDSTHIAGRSGAYFTMTSSAYLVKDNGEWKHTVVFEIDKSKVFAARHQAVLSPAAIAYVERMASKFSLTLPGAVGAKGLNFRPDGGRAQVIVCNYIDGQPSYSNSTWTCTVDAWGINKYEPDSYYFRNIAGENPTAERGSYPYSFGADISLPGKPFFNGWNRSSEHRSLWSVDPHYTTGVYPVQYRPAVDNQQINYYGRQGEPSLAYLSYNDLSTNFDGLSSADGYVSLYSTENTFPDNRLGGLWQHDLAGSEVVIGARIHINGVDETQKDYDLYRNRIGIFFPSATDFATYFITTINNQFASQSSMTYRYYDWDNPDNNSGTVIRTKNLNYSNYKLYYKDKPLTPEVMASLMKFTVPATVENGDGKVIPWVSGMYVARREIDPDTNLEKGDIQRLDMETNEFKSLIYDWVGAFDHFNKGRMTYSVPIRYKATEEKVSAKTYRPAVGDYGVVRNAWYRFAIQEINNLGTPVDDLNQKIIPYQASLENTILMEIKVIDWHEFSTTVTLPNTVK